MALSCKYTSNGLYCLALVADSTNGTDYEFLQQALPEMDWQLQATPDLSVFRMAMNWLVRIHASSVPDFMDHLEQLALNSFEELDVADGDRDKIQALTASAKQDWYTLHANKA